MKDKLKEFCKQLAIDCVGIANIGPYVELEQRLKNRISKGLYTGFEEPELKKRVDPKLTMPNVQSIIVCLFPYYPGFIEDSNISKYTYGVDYHIVVKKKLEQIGQYLQNQIEGFEFMSYVDAGPLVDRYLAYQAGLGFYGINSHIINEQYGSYVFIGYILNNYPFECDKPLEKTCMQCLKCAEACPGDAILGNYNINPLRCRSYITQKKEDFSNEDREIMHGSNQVFGCDICQDICPHNQNVPVTKIEAFYKEVVSTLDYEELKLMSNKAFKRKYGDRAFSWRGKKVIMRNFNATHNQV